MNRPHWILRLMHLAGEPSLWDALIVGMAVGGVVGVIAISFWNY